MRNFKNLVLMFLITQSIETSCHQVTNHQVEPTEEQAIAQICFSHPQDPALQELLLDTGFTRNIKEVPTEISFLIADLKFNKSKLKILEMGESTKSYFKGHEQLYGQGQIWKALWKRLEELNLPVWYVGKKLRCQWEQLQINAPNFTRINGEFATSIEQLENLTSFKEANRKTKNSNPKLIKDYAGIIIFRHCKEDHFVRNDFKNRHPNLLILNASSGLHVNNKFYTNLLFADPEVHNHRPRCRAYPKKYSFDLASKIISDLRCNTVVIKPLNSANGWGVIIVAKKDLDDILKLILTERAKIKTFKDKTYSHWAYDNNKLFLVEEYVPSKTIFVDGKPYDGTMRVAFALTHEIDDCDDEIENVKLDFLGSYWKLPSKPITESGTLTELHKSNVKHGNGPASAKVSPKDLNCVKKILSKLLPKIYITMLKTKPKQTLTFLRDGDLE
jgi:hypothetical protein